MVCQNSFKNRPDSRLYGVEDGDLQFEECFNKCFNIVPVLIAISTIEEGIFLDVNQVWLDTLEYSRNEVIGRSSRDLNIFFNFEDRQKVGRMILEDGAVRSQEINIKTKTGKTRTGLFSGDIITLQDKKYFLTTMVDITEKKQTEVKLLRYDRLNSLGQMAATISHEIRNPLSAIQGFLQILMKSNISEGRQKEYFRLMLDELKRTNAIVDEFLLLSRDRPVKLVKQNLNEIIKRILPLIESEASRSQKTIRMELDDIPDLYLDEGETCQLIINMVRNGFEAMDPGKCLAIKTAVKDDKVILVFKDEGRGIKAEDINNIGVPFFTTKENGTGLGLSVCYNIIQRHNGYIEFDTSPKGTTFYINYRTGIN